MISIPALLEKLRSLEIRSLMVEGGASIIRSFLAEASCTKKDMIIDTLIITVAPRFVGDDGIGYAVGIGSKQIPKLEHIRTDVLGQDTVVAARLLKQ